MPRVKIDYELITGDADLFITIEVIVFDASNTALADLQRDRVLAPTPGYRSKNPQPPSPPNGEPYWTLPVNQFVGVFVRATGQSGLSFSMTVTFTVVDDTFSPVTEPYTPATPLLVATIVNGQAEIDTSVRWRKRA